MQTIFPFHTPHFFIRTHNNTKLYTVKVYFLNQIYGVNKYKRLLLVTTRWETFGNSRNLMPCVTKIFSFLAEIDSNLKYYNVLQLKFSHQHPNK